MSDIAIVGDSFGCGEWQYDPSDTTQLKITHSGVSSFLSKLGHNLKNYSYGGASNDDILDQIKSNNIKKQNLIVFATDSLRNIKSKEQLISQLYIKRNYSIEKIHKTLFEEWYKKLAKITEQNNCNVILIGGHANLYTIHQQNHIKICTSSWMSDILKTKIGNLSGLNNESLETLMARKPIVSDDQKKEILDIMSQKSIRLHLTNENPSFPDNVHPDRSCHEILTKKIINFLT